MSRTRHARRSRLEKKREAEAKEKLETRELFRELMERYDSHRAAYVAHLGTDDGFDIWFSTRYGFVIGRVNVEQEKKS